MEGISLAIASALGASGTSGGSPANLSPDQSRWVAAVAKDLGDNRGRSVVIAGDEQSPAVHALAHAMNGALDGVGRTVRYTEPVEANPVDHLESLRDLVRDIDAGLVEMLVIVGGNPVFTTPADLKLDEGRMKKVRMNVHLSLHEDETSLLCHWHIPEAHYLETWGDTRAFDGTVSIIQPLIAPLYNGKGVHEFLAAFTERPEQSAYDIVRGYWQSQRTGGGGQATATAGGGASPASSPGAAQSPAPSGTPSAEFETFWRQAVHDGVVPNTASRPKSVSVRGDFMNPAAGAQGQPQGAAPPPPTPAPRPNAGGMEIVFRPDPTIYDGRFANNGWLQELPKPLTKLTWDNAAIISPATAERLGVGVAAERGGGRQNDITTKGSEVLAEVVELRFRDRAVRAPVWIMPGQPDEVVTLHLGYGRTRAGRVGTVAAEDRSADFQNAYALRTSDAFWSGSGVEISRTGDTYP
ncbi:MAG: hypothetical protein ACRD68_13050, partial [Pyrinomonadaceae bacterium]